MGREEGSGWETHVYLWQIHFDIWQNQYNIVKLKNKIKFKKLLLVKTVTYVNIRVFQSFFLIFFNFNLFLNFTILY